MFFPHKIIQKWVKNILGDFMELILIKMESKRWSCGYWNIHYPFTVARIHEGPPLTRRGLHFSPACRSVVFLEKSVCCHVVIGAKVGAHAVAQFGGGSASRVQGRRAGLCLVMVAASTVKGWVLYIQEVLGKIRVQLNKASELVCGETTGGRQRRKNGEKNVPTFRRTFPFIHSPNAIFPVSPASMALNSRDTLRWVTPKAVFSITASSIWVMAPSSSASNIWEREDTKEVIIPALMLAMPRNLCEPQT